MKIFLSLWTILLFTCVGTAVGQTNISAIRFSSNGDPLNGLCIAWKPTRIIHGKLHFSTSPFLPVRYIQEVWTFTLIPYGRHLMIME